MSEWRQSLPRDPVCDTVRLRNCVGVRTLLSVPLRKDEALLGVIS